MKNIAIFIAGFVAGFAALFMLMIVFGDYSDEVVAAPTTSQPTIASATQQPAPQAPAPVGLNFETVCRPDTKNMTDPQVEAYAKQYVGQQIDNWQGWVYNVASRANGSYDLQIAMSERGLLWARDIVVEKIPNDLALSLSVEQPLTFSGRIERNESFIGVLCNPLVITDFAFH